jgi:transcriptional/translational regulatory protein YebC/TACO1
MLAALEAGAEDVGDSGDSWEVTTAPGEMAAVRDALEAAGIGFDSADITLLATNTVPLDNESDAKKVLRLVDLLEEHDDVQNVYANFDIPDSILELVEA